MTLFPILNVGLILNKKSTSILLNCSKKYSWNIFNMKNYKDILDEENNDTKDKLSDFRVKYSEALKEKSNTWLSYEETCYIYLFRGGGDPNTEMAAFDVDGTIIKPTGRGNIPKKHDDWQFWSIWTKVKLSQAVDKKRFVMFTNQNGVALGLVSLDTIKLRLELMSKSLKIPCTIFVSINKDSFRKPNTGMFELFEKAFNDSKLIDRKQSFYCGDAVGYPAHSDADIKFAESLQLPFLTPSAFVRGHKPKLVGDA